MPRKLPEPRYIKPETMCIGDTVKISYEEGDSRVDRIGVLGKRQRFGSSTSYITPLGWELLLVHSDGTTQPPRVKVVLLERKADDDSPTLDGIDV